MNVGAKAGVDAQMPFILWVACSRLRRQVGGALQSDACWRGAHDRATFLPWSRPAKSLQVARAALVACSENFDPVYRAAYSERVAQVKTFLARANGNAAATCIQAFCPRFFSKDGTDDGL